jgi:hypothetical protein
MENQQSGYESYWKEAWMVPAFHSKAVSHGKNVQATYSRAGTVVVNMHNNNNRNECC